VIIGGAAITGGRGSVPASLLGILVIGEVRDGLVISGVSLYGQIIVSGVLVVAAVAVDRLITGRGERSGSLRREVARGINRVSLRQAARPISKEE
jgi:ribose/xylose/arabinose/galactoside ABC-type transport system permease subunit